MRSISSLWKWPFSVLFLFTLLASDQVVTAKTQDEKIHQIGVANVTQREIALSQKLSTLFDLKQVVITDQDDEHLRIKKQRFNSALIELQSSRLEFATGKSALDLVLGAGKCVVEAGQRIFEDPNEHVKLHSSFLAVAKYCEGVTAIRIEAAGWHRSQLDMALNHRLEAEVQLAKAKEAFDSRPTK